MATIEEKVTLSDEQVGRWSKPALVAGIALLVVGYILGHFRGDGMSRFMHAYLWGFTMLLSFAFGGLFFILITTQFRSKWSIVLRRLAENVTAIFPMLVVLSLPIVITSLVGSDSLYPWLNEHAKDDHVIHSKLAWLNGGFFGIRVLIYTLVGALLSRYFRNKSIQQDTSKDPAISERLRIMSAPGIIVFALTCTFASFDLLMSLAPKWFSTIYGVYYFAGSMMSIMAILVLAAKAMQRGGRIKESVTVEHYHDLGKLLFGFVFFWSYIAFSQFMLIWYGNIPEETEWYHLRMHGGWEYVSAILLVGHFAFPFLCLVTRQTKRNTNILMGFCIWLLVMQAVDLYWLIFPSYGTEFVLHPPTGNFEYMPSHYASFSPIDIITFGGFILLFVYGFTKACKGTNLIPVGDPNLSASQHFENF